MRTWWRNKPLTVAETLKGAQRIVYEEIARMLANNNNPSITSLAEQTGYSEPTVWKSLAKLRKEGLIEMYQPKKGMPAQYRIVHTC
jgi:biotin operon repressor